MERLDELLRNIRPANEAARNASKRRWDSLAKPLGSLGLLENTVSRIAALTGSEQVRLKKRVLIVACADNGVVRRGVSQSDESVTAAVASALGAGESTVNYMAGCAGCEVLPVDMGILDFAGAPGVLNRRIRNGTEDITACPAMTRDECVRAIETGAVLVREQHERGADVILTGEMGIGNTTTSAAVLSVLLNAAPEGLVGRGAGLSDEGLSRKLHAVKTAIAVNRPDAEDVIDVLSKLGGLDIAALCGVFLGGARYRVPVVIDGLISAAAALCAYRLCENARCAMLASHVSAEPAGALVLDELGLSPLITAQMRLGEGSGAVALLGLIDMALAVYNSGHSFDALGIEAYTPQS